nr:immunoglobulin light chain junction region [Macaca mulatta]MOX78203.1 immunoglobulin light chain junction region [Macaca mulatta]MOX78322.1 immunoglobulin light chain junction region [Macaca mulatta]MOX78527.1 immunoglobulin light chain junction region [Macaca mulatta]MOX79309.1 immunoglobulin light chain junction region [Macaca mulatta]
DYYCQSNDSNLRVLF